MKLGDLVRLRFASAYTFSSGLVGIIVEHVPTTQSEVTGHDLVRCLWPTDCGTGYIDKAWRSGSELEVIYESR